MYRVVHIQKDVFSAGRAATKLHNAFLEANIDSGILSLFSDRNDTSKMRDMGRTPKIVARVDYKLRSFLTRKMDQRLGMFTYPLLGTRVDAIESIRKADFVYVHWVLGGFFNFTTYRKLAGLGKPVIMVMHDMWPVTGGCHHSFDCVKYRSKCINCPMFGENGILQWPTRGFEKKKNLYSEFKNLYFVSPSQWLYKCAKESFLTNDKPIFHIPNITDQNLYKHVNRKMARQFLNLSENEYIVGFGAFELSSPYKGWTELQKALRILAEFKFEKDISVLIFGGNINKEIADAIPFRTRFMGFLSDGYSTALVYNAIDVFIAPSLADNLPTAILESEACETPVVGFDVGGIPEIIAHKKNGYLAKYRDPEDLAKGIHYCYENEVHGYLLPEFGKNEIMMKHRTMLENIDKGIYS